MSKSTIDRRKALQLIGISAGAAMTYKTADAAQETNKPGKYSFTFSLNMATIRGHKLGFVKELQTASAAGFRAVEIWVDSLHEYLAKGGTVAEAKKHLDGLGLKIANTISFNEWIVDDDATRKTGIENMKREMGMLAELGCHRVAATGFGVKGPSAPALDVIAERYRTILELGDRSGVVPQLEMWGFMKNLQNVSEVLYSAMQSGHPSAKILLDIFHFYRGQTKLDTLKLIDPSAVDILHMNDCPAGFSPDVITDADRVYPGDGVAPIKRILRTLGRNNHPLVLSVEVFNPAYYKQDALLVAKTAFRKLKAVVDEL